MKLFKTLSVGALLIALASCSSHKKVIYLDDVEKIPAEMLSQRTQLAEPVLGPGDLLNIRVYGPEMAALAPFNKGQSVSEDGTVTTLSTNTSTSSMGGVEGSTEFYLVNANGDIDFPMLGIIHVTGRTKQQLAEEICNEIYPKYVKFKPTVEIRLMNFRVTVLGSVNSPGQYTSKNERLNVLEALAMAGDLDIKGERENVLLYRTNPDGSREVHRLNLHDRDLLLSPYFNLQQNDFIYVEPNRSARQNSWQMHQGWTTTISIVSGLSSIAGLVIGIINLSK